MGKLFKGFIYLLALLLFITALTITTLVLLVNLNDLKPQLESKVQQLTGRSFVINGGMHWTFFPMLGISAEQVSLGNPENFPTQENFISINNASLNVALQPLLKGEIRLGALTLDGVTAHLIKNADGAANWQNLIQKQPGNNENNADNIKVSGKYKITVASISSVTIKNSNVALDDATSNQHIKITDLNLSAENINIDQAFPLKIKFNMITTPFPNPIPVQLTSQVIINSSQQGFTLQNLEAGIANMHLQGALNAKSLTEQPVITGSIEIPSFNAKQFLNTFGKNIAADALNQLTASFDLSATPTLIQINHFQAKVDDSSIKGNINVRGKDRKEIQFNLMIDQFNATRFMTKPTVIALNNLSPPQ